MAVPKKRPLNICEVRERLREVREDALDRDRVIHWGDRGRDELVTLSSDLFQRLIEHPGEPLEEPVEDAWAAFETALAEGRQTDSGDVGPRRRLPGLPQTSSVAWDETPAMACDEPQRRRRRTAE
jgi:hypothetical protein